MSTTSSSASGPLAGRTVLVVEDGRVDRLYAAALAQNMGAGRVLEAEDGLEGLERLAEVPEIDLILSDLEMPRMDGISFLGELAARGYRPAVIIVSAQDARVLDTVRIMAETYGLSVLGIIPKPLTRQTLERLVGTGASPALPARIPTDPPMREIPGPEEIRRGIRNQEFLCFYQPQVSFQDAALMGVEALVRWRHPEHGLLGPGAFLSQAEEDEDLISALTLSLLGIVARDRQAWLAEGVRPKVSINLCARSLGSPAFGERLMEACTSLGLPPGEITFEVTETVSVENLGHTLANLARLRMKGYTLSIDDFGTGFSTFQQLERIPFSELKLDMSITRNLPASERHGIMATSLLQMARDLKMETVAEGVETPEAWAALRSLGCDQAQGYLVARPMPPEQLPGWAGGTRGAPA